MIRNNKFKVFWGLTSLGYFTMVPILRKERTPPLGTHLLVSMFAPVAVIVGGITLALDVGSFGLQYSVHTLDRVDNEHRRAGGQIRPPTTPFKYSGTWFTYKEKEGFKVDTDRLVSIQTIVKDV